MSDAYEDIGGGLYLHRGKPYVYVPDHKNANKFGFVQQHRYIASEKLGRPLKDGEYVRHINRDKSDNRPENLEVYGNPKDLSKRKIQEAIFFLIENGYSVTKVD